MVEIFDFNSRKRIDMLSPKGLTADEKAEASDKIKQLSLQMRQLRNESAVAEEDIVKRQAALKNHDIETLYRMVLRSDQRMIDLVPAFYMALLREISRRCDPQ